MRFRLLFLLLSLPVLLAACNPDPEPGPRIDLVGSTRFVSASRLTSISSNGTTTAAAADTFTTRLYAETPGRDAAALRRLRITVQYSPLRLPFVYAIPYNPDLTPNDAPLVYLDTLLPSGVREAAFQFTANNRSTSGKAIWRFEAEDVNGRTNSRSFQLTMRNSDSALLGYHPYMVRLESPAGFDARNFLELGSGLTFPGYTLYQTPANQKLVDLVYLPVSNAPTLATPNDPRLNLTKFTTKNATALRRTTLDAAGFSAVTTATGLQNAFTNGTAFPDVTRTGTIAVNQVIAFRTDGDSVRTGLLLIDELQTAPIPAIRMRVRVTRSRQ